MDGVKNGFYCCLGMEVSYWMKLLIFFICCLGDSDEKSKRGLKRKKFFLSTIENDFFFKRRFVRVWIYFKILICIIIVYYWKICKYIVSVKSMLFMKKKMCIEECLFVKWMVILKGKFYVLVLLFFYFLLICRCERIKRRRRK